MDIGTTTILSIIIGVLFVISVIEGVIIAGATKNEKSNGEIKNLTGREIEFIRRKLTNIGMQSITIDEVFSLILTIRNTHLGTYIDEDPYIPANPYEDV